MAEKWRNLSQNLLFNGCFGGLGRGERGIPIAKHHKITIDDFKPIETHIDTFDM